LGHHSSVHGIDWVAKNVAVNQRLGSIAITAQVHSERFTAAMMRAAQAQGAELRLGHVTGVVRRRGGAAMAGVEMDGEVVEGDAVVIALGPWSIRAGWRK
jgi:glycine/D-amino acid oxidase-like deaminating enzyme